MRSGAVIFPLLSDYNPLTNVISMANMFAVRAQQPSSSPYLVYREISSIPLNTKGDSTDVNADPRLKQRSILDVTTVQISVFADNYLTVENAAALVREALDREHGAVNAPYNNTIAVDSIVFDNAVDDFDEDFGNKGIYIKHLDFTIRLKRLFTGLTYSNSFSVQFDGVDEFIDYGDSDFFTPGGTASSTGWSLSCWFKLDSTGSTQFILGKNNQFISGSNRFEWDMLIRLKDQLRFRFYFGDNNSNFVQFDTVQTFTSGVWYNAICTYDLSQTDAGFNMYINGNLKNSSNGGATVNVIGSYGAISNTENSFFIGRSGSNYFSGKVDEVAIYQEVINQTQATAIYNSGATADLTQFPLASDNLIGWWRMGDAGSTFPTIINSSPFVTTTLNGTMTNQESTDITTDIPT